VLNIYLKHAYHSVKNRYGVVEQILLMRVPVEMETISVRCVLAYSFNIPRLSLPDL